MAYRDFEFVKDVFKNALEKSSAASVINKIAKLYNGIEYRAGKLVLPGVGNVPRLVDYDGSQTYSTVSDATVEVDATEKFAGIQMTTARYNSCPQAFDNAVAEMADSVFQDLWTPVSTVLLDAGATLFKSNHALKTGTQSNVSTYNAAATDALTDVEAKAALSAAISQMKRMLNWNGIPCNAEMTEVEVLTGVAGIQDGLEKAIGEDRLSDGSKPYAGVKVHVTYRPELSTLADGFIIVRTDEGANAKALVAGISQTQNEADQNQKDSKFHVLNVSGAAAGRYQFAHKVTLT